jgi:hypothetical protein
MKLGIVAGNRLLPIILAEKIKQQQKDCRLTIFAFKGETSKAISHYSDEIYWLDCGRLADLRRAIEQSQTAGLFLAGQISPWRIFQRNQWDSELTKLLDTITDIRPHTIFQEIIKYLEKTGVKFLDSTLYLKDILAGSGSINGITPDLKCSADIEFGRNIISGYVELDVGQTIVIKNKTVIALEGLEGTDKTIGRGFKIAGHGCTILKFCRARQDLRFDLPVIGMSTLKLLRKIKAAALVVEKDKTIILEKEKFINFSYAAKIPILGR